MNPSHNPPQRTMQFYLDYLLLLIVSQIPIVLIILFFASNLSPLWILGLVLGGILILSLAHLKPLYITYALAEDVINPRMLDISDQELPPFTKMEPEIMWLELEGFERLGEFEQKVEGIDQAITIWKFYKAGGKINASIILGGDGTTTVEFITYGTEGLVTTYSNKGRSLKTARAYYASVQGSIEAALKYHILQVQKRKQSLGSIVPVKTMTQFFKMDQHYSPDDQVYLRRGLYHRVLSTLFINIAITPGYLLLMTRFLPIPPIDMMSNDKLMLSFTLLVFGLTAGFILEQFEKGIDGKKFLKSQDKKRASHE